MSLTTFLQSLFDDGRVAVGPPGPIADADRAQSGPVLLQAEQIWRADLPDGLPEFDVDAALWAAERIYVAAQCYAFRDVDTDVLATHAAIHYSQSPQAGDHYSVDLCFRYLFDLHRMARVTAASDPLNDAIVSLVSPWPLSAVGLIVDPAWTSVFDKSRGLRTMLVDRVVERSDEHWMQIPEMSKLTATAVGAFPNLVPAFVPEVNAEEDVADD